MGVAKKRMMAEEDQGWRFVDDKYVCDDCVEEPFLKRWVSMHADAHACSYCGRRSERGLLAIAINDLFAFINEGLRAEYDDAGSWYPYDSEDKTLVGIWSDSHEMADALEVFANERLRDQFGDSFESRMFCPRDPYGLAESEAFMSGWRRFGEHVKHRTRYYFLADPSAQNGSSERHGDELSVTEIPTYLGEAVRELGLVREIGIEETLFRVRLGSSGETFQDAEQLGTAPTCGNARANRMSPAGIAMFYGAADEQTAIAETYEQDRDPSRSAAASVGAFKSSRPLHVIDLTGEFALPSLFDESVRHLREKVVLLGDFARDIAKPIQRDREEHIDYVPTQIVTEYFRHVFRVDGTTRIDGVMYRSSRRPGGVCYVLFVDHQHCVDGEVVPDLHGLQLILPAGAARVVDPRGATLDGGLRSGRLGDRA